MTNGLLEVKGNFSQSGNAASFAPSTAHKTRFNLAGSATVQTRTKMAEISVENLLLGLAGKALKYVANDTSDSAPISSVVRVGGCARLALVSDSSI